MHHDGRIFAALFMILVILFLGEVGAVYIIVPVYRSVVSLFLHLAILLIELVDCVIVLPFV